MTNYSCAHLSTVVISASPNGQAEVHRCTWACKRLLLVTKSGSLSQSQVIEESYYFPQPNLDPEIQEAEMKAWDALSRYKFQMFGYWAAIWVHLNRISGSKRSNPWKQLVDNAKAHNKEQS